MFFSYVFSIFLFCIWANVREISAYYCGLNPDPAPGAEIEYRQIKKKRRRLSFPSQWYMYVQVHTYLNLYHTYSINIFYGVTSHVNGYRFYFDKFWWHDVQVICRGRLAPSNEDKKKLGFTTIPFFVNITLAFLSFRQSASSWNLKKNIPDISLSVVQYLLKYVYLPEATS